MSFDKIIKKCNPFFLSLVGVMRDDDFMLSSFDIELMEGDELYFVCDENDIQKIMALFGYDGLESHRIAIVGAGNIGLFLAEELEKDKNNKIKLIEVDEKRAEFVAKRLERATVINGDALSQQILTEANVQSTETVVAVSNDDQVNILSSLLAKQAGCSRIVVLMNNAIAYSSLVSSLNIDVVVNPREITVSSILQHLRKGKILSVHSICKGKTEIIEAEAIEHSEVVGKHLSTLSIPEGVMIVAIIHKGKLVYPEDSTIIYSGDRVIVANYSHMTKKVEKLFDTRYDFY